RAPDAAAVRRSRSRRRGAERALWTRDRRGRAADRPGHPATSGERGRARPGSARPGRRGARRRWRLPRRPHLGRSRARPRRSCPGGRDDAGGVPRGRLRRVSSAAPLLRPIIAIVGRPNVGKSTLFNRLVERRRSLVRDVPGVTRDRLYGLVTFERWQATVVDTGGFEPRPTSDLVAGVRNQVLAAIEEADLIVFVVDGRTGLTPLDEEIAAVPRRSD